jgi:PleD family two-component response regulator
MRPRRATVSIGLAKYKGSQTGLFNSADAALYRAKDSGKNCVVVADA